MGGPSGRIFGRLVPPGAARLARLAAAGLSVLLALTVLYVWCDSNHAPRGRFIFGDWKAHCHAAILVDDDLLSLVIRTDSPLAADAHGGHAFDGRFGYEWEVEYERTTRWLYLPYWLLFVVAVTPPTALALLWWRRRRKARLAPGRCRQCGYDVRATPERCPECGTSIAVQTVEARAS